MISCTGKFSFKKKSDNAVDEFVSTTEIEEIINTNYFRYYQKDMWDKFIKSFDPNSEYDPMYSAATGTGKTEVFKFFIPYHIAHAREMENNEGLVFGLICHRLCLINDLNTRIIPIITNKPIKNWVGKNPYINATAGCGLDKSKIQIYIVNSDNSIIRRYNFADANNQTELEEASNVSMNKILNSKHVKDMKEKDLIEEVNENRKNGIHSFFICLYQSVSNYISKLSKLNFDFIICDEIHELNSMGEKIFFDNVEFFKTCKYRYFFSATFQFNPDDDRLQLENDILVDDAFQFTFK